MHKTKVSRAVSALEKRRWITRAADEADRRVEHLKLTKTGEEAYRALVPIARSFEARLLERASAPDREAVAKALKVLEAIAGVGK
jgi:DNA-binding MarR family transcriptional regulator